MINKFETAKKKTEVQATIAENINEIKNFFVYNLSFLFEFTFLSFFEWHSCIADSQYLKPA